LPPPAPAAPAAPAAPPTVDLSERASSQFSPLAIWGAIRKHWMLIVALTSASTLVAAFYTLGQTKIYQAEATILFDPQPPRPLGTQVQAVVDVGGEYWNNKEYYKTQFWIIQSQRNAALVVKQLGLHKDPSFLANTPAGQAPARPDANVEDAARVLRGRIAVEQIRDSRLAVIKLLDADPKRAQRVLSALVDTYTQNNLDDAVDQMNLAADWLSSQVDTLKRDLEASEMALHDYKKDKNILSVSMDDQSNMLRGEMQQLSSALTAIQVKREQYAARRNELAKILPDEPQLIPATELIASPLLQQLRGEFLTTSSERDAMVASGKGAHHPDVMAIQARVDASRSALMNEITNVRNGLDHDLGALSTELNSLRGLFETAKGRAFDLNLLEIEYNRMKRNKENNEKLYGVVTERSKENDLTRMLRINNIRVADRPQTPRKPVTPNVPLGVATGLAAGLLLGLGAAVGREQMDRSIRVPGDIEQDLGISVLGLLPVVDGPAPSQYAGRRRKQRPREEPNPGSTPELVVHEHPSSGIAEATRAIRTNIMFMSPDRPYRTLLVTSAAPSEGKTTVACCIAVVMAQAGKRVLLLDCDMRRPRVHRIFRTANDLGATTALLDMDRLDEVVRPTEVPNLSILTTGPLPPNPSEILHSEAFARLLAGLRDRFDSVVIDSPPVAPVTDAAVLSTKVDGTVLVVRALQTRKDLARRATRSLRDVGGHIVGAVLNAVDFERREYGYYQYYYYKRQGYAQVPADAPASNDEHTPAA
jgi:capsular exopolysaccharide synthesis family protein